MKYHLDDEMICSIQRDSYDGPHEIEVTIPNEAGTGTKGLSETQPDAAQLAFLADRITTVARFPWGVLRRIQVAGLDLTLVTPAGGDQQGDPYMTISWVAGEIDCTFAVTIGGVWGLRLDDAGSFFLPPWQWWKIHEVLSVLGYAEPAPRYYLAPGRDLAIPADMRGKYELMCDALEEARIEARFMTDNYEDATKRIVVIAAALNAFKDQHCVHASGSFTFTDPR